MIILTYEMNKSWYWKKYLNYYPKFVYFDNQLLNQLNNNKIYQTNSNFKLIKKTMKCTKVYIYL